MLEIRRLTVRYRGRSKPAVSDLTLRIGHGEFVLLAGPSASGKSTAMQAVCGFIPHIIPAECEGEVEIEGTKHVGPEAVAGVACMVQQDPETQFCTETVEEEVAFGPENFRFPPAKIKNSIDHALRSVDAAHLLDRKLATLSGGEKQKVAIASMLAVQPKLLILDEPTASLDPKAISQVVNAIGELRRTNDIAVVIVEHRVKEFMEMADRLLTMREGSLVSDDVRGMPRFTTIETGAMCAATPRMVEREKAKSVISARGLCFEVDGHKILQGIDLEVPERSVVALMGDNGSGKTTLLRHLVGLQRVQNGWLRIKDRRVNPENPVDPWTLGRDIGLVFQNPNHQIFENTVEKEIQFAPRNYRTSTGEEESVTQFESSERLKRYTHPHCLSFGQKRRVNILSASSHNPEIILLDEPFAGQDQDNADKIISMISRLQSKGKTVIVVTHDQSFARNFCTDVVVLMRGRVLDSGPTARIREETWTELSGGGAG